jgi:hypothetical protein
MSPEKYPDLNSDKEILMWNTHLKKQNIFPIELLLEKNNKNFDNLKKNFQYTESRQGPP